MTSYTARERFWLKLMAAVGVLGVNGTFLYGVLQPGLLREALTNPVSLAFIVEALIMVAALAYLLVRWQVSRIGRVLFVLLSFVGGLAFAVPAALLWPRRS